MTVHTLLVPALLAALWFGWRLVHALRRRWRDPAHWPEPVLRRGSVENRCGWMVEVRQGLSGRPPSLPFHPPRGGEEGRESAPEPALRLARHLASRGLRISFFVPATATSLAAEMASLGHEVGWLGAPGAPASGNRVESDRALLWRPLGGRPSAGELAAATRVGARLVAHTFAIGGKAAPDGLAPVGTDLVLVPEDLPLDRVDAWARDCERRAVFVEAVGEG